MRIHMTNRRSIRTRKMLLARVAGSMVVGILACLPSAFAQNKTHFVVRGSERHFADAAFTPAEVPPAAIAKALRNFEDQLKKVLRTDLPDGPTPADMRGALATAIQGKVKPPERMKITYSATYYPDPDPLSNGKWAYPGADFLTTPAGRLINLEIAPETKGFSTTAARTAEISYKTGGFSFKGERGQNPTGASVVVHADVETVLTLKVELDPAYLVTGSRKDLTAVGSATDLAIKGGTIQKTDRKKSIP